MNTNRLLILTIVITFLLAGLLVRLFYIQIIKSDEIKYAAKRQHIRVEKIKAERGLIMDRNMVVMAYTVPVKSFFVSLKQAHKKNVVEKIAQAFSKVTGKPVAFYMEKMRDTTGRVCIENASGEQALQLKEIKRDGLECEDKPVRNYPYNNLASHLLGYAAVGSLEGTDGVERIMDSSLHGIDGKRVILSDPLGNMVSVVEEATQMPQIGNSVMLTIDKNIQEMVEQELSGIECAYAVGIVMDPQTGEVLALANQKNFDLNNYSQFPEDVRRNHAVSDMYEPGSTFKALSLATIFDQQLCREEEIINTENGKYHFKNIVIKDAHNSSQLSVKEVFTHSSNIGMSKLSQRISSEVLYKYLRGMGIGISTNIDLPAEAEGLIAKPSKWSVVNRSSISYGYTVAVTPIQLITAYAALINGGKLMQPYVVKRVQSLDGKIVTDRSPRVIRQVISPATSEKMRKLFAAVVEEGTGKKAAITGVSIGGKTGTSQMYKDSEYKAGKYNASFIGFFPSQSPKYLCLVLVNSPSNGSYYGGDVAAPVFKQIAGKILKYDPSVAGQPVQPIAAGTSETAGNAVNAEKIENSVKSQIKSDLVINKTKPSISKNIMPDLKGLSIRDAIAVLSQLNVGYTVNGSRRVQFQSIPAGSRVNAGMKCDIKGEDIKVPILGDLIWN